MALTISERDKAALRPIDGPYREFATEVRRLLGYYPGEHRNYLSSRMAQTKTGVSHTSVSTMARGFRANRQNTIQFAQALRGDPDLLLRLSGHLEPEGEMADPLVRIGPEWDISALAKAPLSPFKATAGQGAFLGDTSAESDVMQLVLPADTRAIQVEGECMQPYFESGDILLVRRSSSAESGQKVIALLNDDTLTCKRFVRDDTGAYLEAVNGNYPRIDADRFQIVGVVCGSYRPES